MAKYTVIAEVGKALTNMLRDMLTPEPIDKPETIGICEPKNRGEYTVGIHPYDIKEDLTSQKRAPIKLPDGREQDPPSLLELYYMISVSSKSEIEVRAAEESRIIGKIIQIFKDNQTIPSEYLGSDSVIDAIPISMIPLEMEEKVKIWTMFGESYKLSVFYLVGPVAIDSEIIRKPQPVETVILGTVRKIPKKIVQFETRITEEDIDDEYTQDYASEEEDEEGDDDFGSDDDDFGRDDFGDDEGNDKEDEEEEPSDDELDDLFGDKGYDSNDIDEDSDETKDAALDDDFDDEKENSENSKEDDNEEK